MYVYGRVSMLTGSGGGISYNNNKSYGDYNNNDDDDENNNCDNGTPPAASPSRGAGQGEFGWAATCTHPSGDGRWAAEGENAMSPREELEASVRRRVCPHGHPLPAPAVRLPFMPCEPTASRSPRSHRGSAFGS